MRNALVLALIVLFAAAAPPPTLDSIRADKDAPHRVRAAVDFSLAAEHRMEAAYEKGDTEVFGKEAREMMGAVEIARDALGSGEGRLRNAGAHKYAEVKSHELLVRLGDLQHKMGGDERETLDPAIATIQRLHDQWLEAIMGRI